GRRPGAGHAQRPAGRRVHRARGDRAEHRRRRARRDRQPPRRAAAARRAGDHRLRPGGGDMNATGAGLPATTTGLRRPSRGVLAPPDLAAAGTLAVTVASFALVADGFWTASNLRGVLLSVSIVAVIAIGQNLVILAGEIDVSVGS